ncbi:SDR family oxidoreductase [Baekduia soli]|uniref:SDR family oxidoreductase n=1 Tax=Baekduia soli TaxID=496014 RepID=A0A5B8U6R5_9ACTN|nr:SDR family NAD(P)-dependent oxidoreductase [Baekduia soli]QEC48352.1 SDR family oxidoreductase [Baekduia soli]
MGPDEERGVGNGGQAQASSGRVVVVTGAARAGGIGRASAEALARAGWRVVLSDHPSAQHAGTAPEGAPDLRAAVQHVGAITEASGHVADVADPAQVEALADHALERFGRLDGWINNAGLNAGVRPLVDVTDEEWDLNLSVMATGTFYGSRAAARRMIDAGTGWGRIVNMSSQAGKTGMPLLSAYCAAKFAIIGITQALSGELGRHGITVNAVCPGTVDTPLLELPGGIVPTFSAQAGLSGEEYRARLTRHIPLGRFVRAEEIAATVAFLCSDAADAITGEAVNVTGGQEVH